jgi:probable F420-dependent oxidoreductase
MVLLSYMAARCDLELATGILVLPQRETALLAKQAAEVNRLARGNLRLGVGAGWNRGEFDALGAEFKNRGRRLDEQINLLRLLWTEEVVTFSGDFHTISGCGVGGSPSQPLIPIWVGATTDRALERVGRLADGCFLSASVQPDDEFQRIVSLVRNVAETAGRDPSAIGFEARVLVGGSSDNDIIEAGKAVESWRGAGASHVWLETRYAELRNIDDLDALIRRAGELLR